LGFKPIKALSALVSIEMGTRCLSRRERRHICPQNFMLLPRGEVVYWIELAGVNSLWTMSILIVVADIAVLALAVGMLNSITTFRNR
jgi:hypothetical protein